MRSSIVKRNLGTNNLCKFFNVDFDDLQSVLIDMLCEDFFECEHYEVERSKTLNELLTPEQIIELAGKLLEHYSFEESFDCDILIDDLNLVMF